MPRTIIEHEFSPKEIVYLKTDSSQLPRIITCLLVYEDGSVSYELACGVGKSFHFGFEMSREKNFSLTE